MTTHATYAHALVQLERDHPGAIIDEVIVVLDDCIYTLGHDGEGNVVGTDDFTPVERWYP